MLNPRQASRSSSDISSPQPSQTLFPTRDHGVLVAVSSVTGGNRVDSWGHTLQLSRTVEDHPPGAEIAAEGGSTPQPPPPRKKAGCGSRNLHRAWHGCQPPGESPGSGVGTAPLPEVRVRQTAISQAQAGWALKANYQLDGAGRLAT